MRKLKVFLSNIDGRRYSLTAATSRSAAYLKVQFYIPNLSVNGYAKCTITTGHDEQVELAMANPECVFISTDDRHDIWEKAI